MRAARALAVLVVAGCVTHVPATEVVVVIDAEPSIVRDAQRLHVTVLGGARGTTLTSQADQMIGSSTAAIRWPVRVALAPAMGDPNRLFAIEGDALDSVGGTLGIVRARSSYVAGRTLELRLTLEGCCRTVATTCTTDQTCRSCMCASADVPVSTIPDYAPPDAGVQDAGPPRDFAPRNLPATVWASATGTIVVSMSATINTDTGEVLIDGHASRDFTPLDVPAVGECHAIFAIVTGAFTVAAGATVAVTGSRGLAIAAAGAIDVEGTIDVGAHGGTAGAGGLVRHGGGGYGSEGGLPGSCSGASGVIPTFGDPSLAGLCGGTASDAPSSGAGGGALQLAARSSVTVGPTGVIRAVGGGGTSGGSGGSGGGVLVQAPTVHVAGTISVNGGGGGGGGGPGADGVVARAAAPGGASVTTPGSCGNAYSPSGGAGAWQGGGAGNGGAGSYVNCVGSGCIGGGGGGGGAGRIRIEADVRDYVAGRLLEYTALSGVFTDGPLSP